MKYLYVIQEQNSCYGKFGICYKSNPSRILNGQTYYKNKIIIHNLYEICKNDDYELYQDYDKIVSFIGKYTDKIKKVEEFYNIKLDKLHKLSKFLPNQNGGTEIFDIEGLNLLNEFITNELPLLRLTVNQLSDIQINSIVKEIYQKNSQENKYDAVFNRIFGNLNSSKMNLRSYQKTITSYILDYFKINNNIYLNLATGGGKSFIVFYILKVLKPSTIIIFSPRKKINQQNISSKYINFLESDYSIYNFSKNNYFDKFMELPKKIIVCCTQSADKLYNEIYQKNLGNIFIWFDEAHWGVENWISDINKKYWIESNDIRYRLFTSASPDENFVKSNLNYFGEYYKPFTVKYLINNDYLCKIIPYMYETNQDDIKMCEYILTHFKEKNRNFGFSFHNRDDNAYNLFTYHYAKYKSNETNIKPFLLIDHTNLKREIEGIELNYTFTDVECFESNTNSIAYVVKKYDMGYDFSKLDFITFSDAKLSPKDIIQCIGRGTRIYETKICHILLPIFICEDNTEYDKIVNVLQYLINDIGIDFESIFTNNSSSTGKELSSENYDGTNEIKSIIIQKLNMIINTTKQLERIRIKFNIYNEIKYNEFRLNNEFYKLKNNIYDYKGFKWKPIIDPNSSKYYGTFNECYNAFKNIKYSLKQLSNVKEKQKKLMKLKINGNYYDYDNKIPPYNKLKECYY